MTMIGIPERIGPRTDRLGIGLFVFHFVVVFYILFGWMMPWFAALAFYLMFLPLLALQWIVNRGSCIINNIETWLRTGHWRDACNREEAAFMLMLSEWWLGIRPRRMTLNAIAYATTAGLWFLGLGHIHMLAP